MEEQKMNFSKENVKVALCSMKKKDASTKQAVILQEKNDQVSEVQRFEWKRNIVLGLDYHIFLQELNPN